MTRRYYIGIVLLLCVASFIGCKSAKLGWTDRKADKKYFAITGYDDNFGDKRLSYAKAHYKYTEFACHLEKYGNPEMIYEFITPKKNWVYRLYYMKLGYVYLFESKSKSGTKMFLVGTEHVTAKDSTIYKTVHLFPNGYSPGL